MKYYQAFKLALNFEISIENGLSKILTDLKSRRTLHLKTRQKNHRAAELTTRSGDHHRWDSLWVSAFGDRRPNLQMYKHWRQLQTGKRWCLLGSSNQRAKLFCCNTRKVRGISWAAKNGRQRRNARFKKAVQHRISTEQWSKAFRWLCDGAQGEDTYCNALLSGTIGAWSQASLTQNRFSNVGVQARSPSDQVQCLWVRLWSGFCKRKST